MSFLPSLLSPAASGWGECSYEAGWGGGGGETTLGFVKQSPRARAASLSGRGISHKVLYEPVKGGPKAGSARAEWSAK